VSSQDVCFELEIHSLAAGGDGVGRAPDGRVVFVPDTAPGDRVSVRVVEMKKRFARARVQQLLSPGHTRTDPVCAVFGSCGGCAWQHVDYATQLEAKAAFVADALRRIGGLVLPNEIGVDRSPSPYGYRGRARLHVLGRKVGFRRRRSHAICATRRCPILLPTLDGALRELADRAPAEDGEWELAAAPSGEVRVNPPGREGEALEIEIGSDRLRFSSGVFVQSNTLLLPLLTEAVWEAAGRGEVAFELYAGAGTFTLGLARRFGRVVAVEGQAAAAGDLRHNLRTQGLDAGVDVVEAPVERALAGTELPQHADVALLDPPRSGLPPGGVEYLVGRAPRRIVFLSCEPATLARDLAVLCAERYRLTAVRGFDLFPQTPHVEVLAVLQRA
jgi:23S rRNA (uracil1939-C5)-methyltransferase